MENAHVDIFELNDGNRLPAVGLGTSRIKPDEMDDVIMSAITIGYRHFDSAQLYNNNAAFGKTLSKVFSSKMIKREDIFITSKAYESLDGARTAGFSLFKPDIGKHTSFRNLTKLAFYHNRPNEVRSSLLECLGNLGLDYVDLFLIHHPAGFKEEGKDHLYTSEDDRFFIKFYEESDHIAIWKEMEKLVEDKLTKSIGVSNFNKDQLSQILQNPNTKIKPAVLQTECHVSLQEKEIVKFCQDHNIAVTGYAALGSPNINFAGVVGSDMVKDEVVCNMARRYNKSPAQILLRFLIQRRVGVIVKSSNPGRLRENISIFDFELSSVDFEELLKLDRGERVFNYPFQIHHPQNPYPIDKQDVI